MLKNKRGGLPLIKILIILVTVGIVFIGWILALQVGISTNEKKINTQISINKLLDGNCFSDEYATIKKSEFTEEKLKKCFLNSENKQLRVKLGESGTYLYSSSKNEFAEVANKCSISSSILCTEMHYPIIYEKEENTRTIEKLTLQIITT